VHRAFSKKSMRAIDQGRPRDPSAVEHARRAGSFRALRLSDLLGPGWRSGPTFEAYRARGLTDAMHVIFPVNDSAESYFGFQRRTGRAPFSETNRDLVAYALRGMKWFHRQVMLSQGLLVAREPLTGGERRLQGLLLTELSEKQIAAKLGQSPQTTHKNVTRLLRKLGVSGRAGLTALWLGTR
jgi:DNA-binding CsgD family transcriptional regulator